VHAFAPAPTLIDTETNGEIFSLLMLTSFQFSAENAAATCKLNLKFHYYELMEINFFPRVSNIFSSFRLLPSLYRLPPSHQV
jgi:hypothetical protein